MLWFKDSPLIGLTDVYFPHEENKYTQKIKSTKPQRAEGHNKNNNFQVMGSSQVHNYMHNDSPRKSWEKTAKRIFEEIMNIIMNIINIHIQKV